MDSEGTLQNQDLEQALMHETPSITDLVRALTTLQSEVLNLRQENQVLRTELEKFQP